MSREGRRSPYGAQPHIYRALLLLYPRRFRRTYGHAMEEHFLTRLAKVRGSSGRLSTLGLWLHILADLFRTAPLERWDAVREGLVRIGLVARRSGLRSTLRTGGRPAKSHGATGRAWDTSLGGRGGFIMDSLAQDIRHSLRRLARTPAFTVTAILIVALGIGVNAAIFTVVDTLLFRPPGVHEPETLVEIYQDADDGRPAFNSFPAFRDVLEYTDVFQGVTAIAGMTAAYQSEGGVQLTVAAYTTSGYLEVLGLTPTVGRWFEGVEDLPGAGATAVVSHRTWRTKLAGDPDVLGRTVRLNGAPVTIVGVGPPDYGGVSMGFSVDFWLSISAMPHVHPGRSRSLQRREDHPFVMKARLASGVTVAQAQTAMDGLADRLGADFPEINAGRGISVYASSDVRYHPLVDGYLASTGAFLMGIVGLVLIIACSNLANLLLVRGASRGREIAVRMAMGSSRGRVVRHLVTESILLSLAGGALGLLLATWAMRAFVAFQPPLPVPAALMLGVDARVLVFGFVLAAVTGVAFGILPALRASRPDLVATLREDTRAASSRGRGFGLRNALVVAQVAVSLILLVGAGMFVRSLVNAQRIDLGFDTDRVAFLQTDVGQAGYTADEGRAFYQAYRERLAAVPGIERVALASVAPVTLARGSSTLIIDGYQAASSTGAVEVQRATVDGDYFETLGIPLQAGRAFTSDDRPESSRVAVVSESMARNYWGRVDVVGERFRGQGSVDSWVEIVGVVADSKVRTLGERPTPLFYRPYSQAGGSAMLTMVRTAENPSDAVAILRREILSLDANLPVLSARTLRDHLGVALFLPRLAAGLLVTMGVLSLLLSSLGIYAVVAFVVSQRTTEVGIRMALGASGGHVVRLVVREVMTLVVIGAVLGLALALLLAAQLAGLLVQVTIFDPVTLLAVGAILSSVAFVAAYLPARKAAGFDPAVSLRAE